MPMLPDCTPRTYRRVWIAALVTLIVLVVLAVLLFGSETAARWIEAGWRQYFGPAQ